MKKRATILQPSGGMTELLDQRNSTQPKDIQLSYHILLACLVVFRVVNACLIRTWFVPDEFWQGPEVAHNLVFGYGHLTWEWSQGLRGYTFPLMFAGAFKFLQILGLDSANALVLVPCLIQAIFAAFGDLYLFKLSTKLFGRKSAKWTLLCGLTSWFTFYCITRTLTNSTETVLTTIALYYWPWDILQEKSKDKPTIIVALSFAALSCLVRPTSAIIWIPLAVILFVKSDQKIFFIFVQVLPVGILALLWSVCVDSLLYGKLTFVQYNFVLFNVVKDMGTFYGSHPWHWYFTQGAPAILFTHLPLFCAGVYKSEGKQRLPGLLILWVIIVYSFLGHKEFRFIFPILPLCMCYCGFLLDKWNSSDNCIERKITKQTLKSSWSVWIIVLLGVTNIPVALYTCCVHQEGVIDVMKYIRQDHSSNKQMSVFYLMPCHSTPFYSHVHKNISMRFLECPPDESSGYIDEAATFYIDPIDWLSKEFPTATGHRNHVGANILPTHIVVFDVLLKTIEPFLMKFNYRECSRFFHSHFPEGRIGKEVVVLCL